VLESFTATHHKRGRALAAGYPTNRANDSRCVGNSVPDATFR
jgi:hypothetical protein